MPVTGMGDASEGIHQDDAAARQVVEELLPQVFERRHAIGSGRFHIRRTSGSPKFPDEVVSEPIYSIDGDRWVRKYASGLSTSICRDGALYLLTHTPQPDGTTRISMSINNPGKVLGRRENRDWWLYCGSFHLDETARFVEQQFELGHWSVIRISDEAVMISIPVSMEQRFKAFSGIVKPLEEGGSIELTVDRKRNGVIPLMRFLGSNGQAGLVSSAEDFVEVAKGIWFPRLSHTQDFHAGDTPGLFWKYELISASLVNEVIPDEDFKLDIPVGTNVSESRTGKNRVMFRVDKEGVSLQAMMEKALADADALMKAGVLPVVPGGPPPVSHRRKSWVLVANLTAAAAGAVFVAWLLWRRQRRETR